MKSRPYIAVKVPAGVLATDYAERINNLCCSVANNEIAMPAMDLEGGIKVYTSLDRIAELHQELQDEGFID